MNSAQQLHSPSSMMHRVLTVAMLSCFALGGWFWSQESSPKQNQATAATISKPVSQPSASFNRKPQACAAVSGDSEPTTTTTTTRYVTKNIEDIQAGDYVLAREEHGDKIELRKVVEAYRRTSYHLRHLTFEALDGSTQTIQTTDEHPFWHAGREEWIDAGRFVIGDLVTFRIGKTINHVGVMINCRDFVHSIQGARVSESTLDDVTWGTRLAQVWRAI